MDVHGTKLARTLFTIATGVEPKGRRTTPLQLTGHGIDEASQLIRGGRTLGA
jgi:hypothetical protein